MLNERIGCSTDYQKSRGYTTHKYKEYFFKALDFLLSRDLIKKEDSVAYLSGSFGGGKGTSFLEISNGCRRWR